MSDCDKSKLENPMAESFVSNPQPNNQQHPASGHKVISNKSNKPNQQPHSQHHRRKPSKKKRKWKPYSKMTWEEKKAVEEREQLRADRIRGEMMDRGRPVAPYNTTQFIMNEHDPYEEDSCLEGIRYKETGAVNETAANDASSCKSSTSGTYSAQPTCTESPRGTDELIEAEYTDSPHMAPEFISQDFSEAYERVQEESLSTMSRDDLVKEHLSLERTLRFLQDKLAEEKVLNNSYSTTVQNVEEELDILRKDNRRLLRENWHLQFGEGNIQESDENQTFQASDCEYEAPNDQNEENEFSNNSKNGEVEMNEECFANTTLCEGQQCEELERGIEDNEAMTVSNSAESNLSVAKISSLSDQEANYEADDALSEDHDTQTTRMKKRKKNHKNKNSAFHHQRVTGSSDTITNENSHNHATEITAGVAHTSAVTVNIHEVDERRMAAKLDRSHIRDNQDSVSSDEDINKEKLQHIKPLDKSNKSCVNKDQVLSQTLQNISDPMDAESYSWDEKGEATATMESLASNDS